VVGKKRTHLTSRLDGHGDIRSEGYIIHAQSYTWNSILPGNNILGDMLGLDLAVLLEVKVWENN
jgi:hypothetical protein